MQKLLSNKNLIKKISCILLIISFSLVYYKNNITTQAFQLEYELINTKDMAMVEVSEKQEAKELQTKDVFQIYKEMKSGTYVSKESPTPVALPAKKIQLQH